MSFIFLPTPKKTYQSCKRRTFSKRRRVFQRDENTPPLFENNTNFKKAPSSNEASEKYTLEIKGSGANRDDDISGTETNMRAAEDIVLKRKKYISQLKDERARTSIKIRNEKQNMRKRPTINNQSLSTNGPSQNQMKPVAEAVVDNRKINGLVTSTLLSTKRVHPSSYNQDSKHKRSRQKSDPSLAPQSTSSSIDCTIVASTIDDFPNTTVAQSERVYDHKNNSDQAAKSHLHNSSVSSAKKVSIISNHAMPYHHLLSNLREITTSYTVSERHNFTPAATSSKYTLSGKSKKGITSTVMSVHDFLSAVRPSSRSKRAYKKFPTQLEPLNFTIDAPSSPDPFISNLPISCRSPSPIQLFQRRTNQKLSAQSHFGIVETGTSPRVVATKKKVAFLEIKNPPKRIDYGENWATKCTTIEQRENRIKRKKETIEDLRKKFVMPLGSTQNVRHYKKELVDYADIDEVDSMNDLSVFTRSVSHNISLPERDGIDERTDTAKFSEYAVKNKFKTKKKVERISPLILSSNPSSPRISYESPQHSIDQTFAASTQISILSTTMNLPETQKPLDTNPPSPVFPSRLFAKASVVEIPGKLSKIDKKGPSLDDVDSIVTHVSESDLEINHNWPSSEEEIMQRKAEEEIAFDRESSAEITVSSLDEESVNEMQEMDKKKEVMLRKSKELNNEVRLDSKKSRNVLAEEEAMLNPDPALSNTNSKAQNTPNHTLCSRASISATLQLHTDHRDQVYNPPEENVNDTSLIYQSHITTSLISDAQLATDQKSTNNQFAEESTVSHIRVPSISQALPIHHNLTPTSEETSTCQPIQSLAHG